MEHPSSNGVGLAEPDEPRDDTGATPVAEEPLRGLELRAWVAFLQSHAAVTRRLEAELAAGAGLPLAEYDVLVQLASTPNGRLRMHELAERVLLSRSGISRLVDRMEGQGLLCRAACDSDRRGAFAVLTPEGLRRLREAAPIHLRGVREHFLSALSGGEQEWLAERLERLTALAR